MSQQVDFSKCRHFDTPRCPNQNLDLLEKAAKALTIPDYNGIKIQEMTYINKDEVNAICGSCAKYEVK